MKKVYLTGALILGTLSVFSQQKLNVYNFKAHSKLGNVIVEKLPSTDREQAIEGVEKSVTPIWSENFTIASAPLTTSNGAWVTGGTNATYWTIASAHPMASNGWTTNLQGSFLSWNSYTANANETNFASTSVSGEITSPTVNLTTASANGTILSFRTEALFCCNFQQLPFKIAVSEDNGTTWSAPMTIDLGVPRSTPTTAILDPMKINVDISSITTGRTATTKVKFLWDGVAADPNGQKNTHYFWLIDDISIYSRYNYDLSAEKFWLADIHFGNAEESPFEHTDIPKSLAGKLTVQAKLRNIGKTKPTNIKLKVDVLNAAGTSVLTETGGTLKNNFAGAYDTLTFASNMDLSTLAAGNYSVKIQTTCTETDENTDNDTMRRKLVITDNYLGQRVHEQNIYFRSPGNLEESGAASRPMVFGNVMHIPASVSTVKLHGLELTVAKSSNTPTTAGTEVEIKVYEVDLSAQTIDEALTDKFVSMYFTIPSSGIPSGASGIKNYLFNFHKATQGAGSVTLEGGKNYLIAIKHDGGATNHLAYGANLSDDDKSSFTKYASGTNAESWRIDDEQILTRMNFDVRLSTETIENEFLSFVNIVPNPTSGATKINYALTSQSDVKVEVMDVTGKVVYTANQGTQTQGKHVVTFDSSEFNAGMYYVTITTGEAQITKKMIKE